ncbi:MAG: trigger factor [Bacteroidetes bacterium]|nr:trigger factor [Bacteroidota bacterium]MBU2584318.1 trigger factor [Bacteroidota bacterium]
MSIEVQKLDNCENEMSVRMETAEASEYFEKMYRSEAKKLTIGGFRKGKAPLSMVKKVYGERLKVQNLDKIVIEKFWKEIDKQKFEVISTPVLTHLDIDDNNNIDFKMKFETFPEVHLKDLKAISAEKIEYEISEDFIDDEIKQVLFSKKSTEPIEVINDHETIAEIEITRLDKSGLVIIGEKTEKTKLYLNSPDANKNLVDSLLSKKSGDEYVFTHLPQHDHHEGHAHKHEEEKFSIKIGPIEKVILPELNDEFVNEISKGDSKRVEEFRQKVKDNLKNRYANISMRLFNSNLMGELVRQNDFNPPNAFIEKTLDSYIEEEKQKYPNKKLPAEIDLEQLRESKTPDAVWGVKWMILRDKLLEDNNLSITDEEIDKIAETESAKTGITKNKMKEYLNNSSYFLSNFKNEKAMKLLEENAQIRIVKKIV